MRYLLIASAFIILAVQREPEKQPKALSVGVIVTVQAEDGSLELRRGKPGHNSAERAPSSQRPMVDSVPQVRQPIRQSSERRPHKRQTSRARQRREQGLDAPRDPICQNFQPVTKYIPKKSSMTKTKGK